MVEIVRGDDADYTRKSQTSQEYELEDIENEFTDFEEDREEQMNNANYEDPAEHEFDVHGDSEIVQG